MNLSKKQLIYVYMMVVYCCVLIVSNTIANRTLTFGSVTMTTAVICFPIIYIINDTMTECFGYENAKRMIFSGLVLNLIAVLLYNICISLPTQTDFSAYNVVFSTTLRATIVSFCGYMAGGFVNAKIMQVMKYNDEKHLMRRCVVSTLFGEASDSIVFNFGMFMGIMSVGQIVPMVVVYVAAKVLYEIILYPVTRKVILKINAL